MVEKARQQEVFSPEDAPTEQRVLAAFQYHAGFSGRLSRSLIGLMKRSGTGFTG
jgi:hypothetical protein